MGDTPDKSAGNDQQDGGFKIGHVDGDVSFHANGNIVAGSVKTQSDDWFFANWRVGAVVAILGVLGAAWYATQPPIADAKLEAIVIERLEASRDELDLTELPIVDRQVANLSRVAKEKGTTVRTLVLRDSKISDKGLQSIAREFSGLYVLDVSGTSISNDGIGHLSSLRYLKTLRMHRTAVDDQVGATLAQFPQLARIDVTHGKVTDKIRSQLAKSARKIHVEFAGRPKFGKPTQGNGAQTREELK